MKFILLITVLLFYSIVQAQSQVPEVKWFKIVSNISNGFPSLGINDIEETSNEEIIIVGADTSLGYWQSIGLSFESSKYSGGRSFIMKTDKNGDVIWKSVYNGMHFGNTFTSVTEASDGGFIAVGSIKESSPSVYGQVLIVKFDSNGIQKWSKIYGGSFSEGAQSICKTKTSGYVILGTTNSNDGDVTGNHSASGDFWLIRIDEAGNIIWNKCYGGTTYESGYSVIQSLDYGFLLAGIATSNNGDLNNNLGAEDGWILEVDSTGNIIWQKNYGIGNNEIERLDDLIQTNDGTIIAAGTAYNDVWCLKLNKTGTIIWSKLFGGWGFDNGFNIVLSPNQNFLITGATGSVDRQVTGNNGGTDGWVLLVDQNGNLVWQKCIGGPAGDALLASFYNSKGDLILAGRTYSQVTLGKYYPSGLLISLGNSNKLKGSLFLDANSNGIKDVGEQNFNNTIVKTQKTGTTFTAQPNGGKFSFNVDTGSYTITVQLFNPYYNVVPASKNTNFTTYFNVDSFGFAIQPIPNQQDLIVHLIPASPARPGFKAQYVLNYKNIGTTIIANGSVKLIKDSRAALSLAFPLPTSVVVDTITWNYTNLKPLDSIAIGIEFQLAPPPTLNINDTLKYTAIILPVAGDLTPADDTSRLRQRVQGSYDPNDKQENFAGKIPLKNVQDGSYINYVIRFQNTGNDTAFFVRLLDTLDTKLDWNSFQMIGSSHAYNLTIKDGNKLNWFFDNIKLPDSTTNLARSIGFVSFRIKPKNNLLANDVISNKASIYFDYNLPIVTNTTNTLVFVETTTAVRDIQNNEMKLLVAPNPNAGQSILQISGKLIGKFEMKVIDNSGKIIMQQSITRKSVFETLQIPMDLQKLSTGVYYIQLQQKEKLWWQKVVVQ